MYVAETMRFGAAVARISNIPTGECALKKDKAWDSKNKGDVWDTSLVLKWF